jgi:uncharacterized protein (DUF302 family)
VVTASDGTYTLHGTTALPFADAVARVREALREEGFGVLTEIDVQWRTGPRTCLPSTR